MVVDYRQLPIFKTLDPEERKGLALLGHPHCKRSFAHVAWMVRWWPLLTCVSMSQLDEDSLCGVHGGWNEQIPTPKNQPALIFAHMPFLNKQAVGQILHQPTVKAYMHWYCLQNMFWFGRMSHMSHMSLGGEVHETLCAVLCEEIIWYYRSWTRHWPAIYWCFDMMRRRVDELTSCLSCLCVFLSLNCLKGKSWISLNKMQPAVFCWDMLRHSVRVSHGWIEGVREKTLRAGIGNVKQNGGVTRPSQTLFQASSKWLQHWKSQASEDSTRARIQR